jgi:hypothetical protein
MNIELELYFSEGAYLTLVMMSFTQLENQETMIRQYQSKHTYPDCCPIYLSFCQHGPEFLDGPRICWTYPLFCMRYRRYPREWKPKETDAVRAQADGPEWKSAGYSGEGMTLAWKCGKAVAYMILGLDERFKVQDWLPEQYLITAKRVKDADVRKLKELY